jgi:hypothetical protein
MVFLTAADYDAVRAALGTDVDDLLVPDDLIGLSIFEGAAEIEILTRVPDAASFTGTAEQRIRNVAILLTAALIAPAIPRIERENFGDYTSARSEDWAARAAQLRQRAETEMAPLLPTSATTRIGLGVFARATGGRGA